MDKMDTEERSLRDLYEEEKEKAEVKSLSYFDYKSSIRDSRRALSTTAKNIKFYVTLAKSVKDENLPLFMSFDWKFKKAADIFHARIKGLVK